MLHLLFCQRLRFLISTYQIAEIIITDWHFNELIIWIEYLWFVMNEHRGSSFRVRMFPFRFFSFFLRHANDSRRALKNCEALAPFMRAALMSRACEECTRDVLVKRRKRDIIFYCHPYRIFLVFCRAKYTLSQYRTSCESSKSIYFRKTNCKFDII